MTATCPLYLLVSLSTGESYYPAVGVTHMRKEETLTNNQIWKD